MHEDLLEYVDVYPPRRVGPQAAMSLHVEAKRTSLS
jgi:hypothetical protein